MSLMVAPALVGALARAISLSLAPSMIRASASVRRSRAPNAGARLTPVIVSLFHTPPKSGLPLKRGGEKPGASRGPRIGAGAATSCSEPGAPSTRSVPGRSLRLWGFGSWGLRSWARTGPAASHALAAINNKPVKVRDAMSPVLPAFRGTPHAADPAGERQYRKRRDG